MVGDKMLINFLTLLVSTIAITYLLSIKNMNIGVKIFCTTIYSVSREFNVENYISIFITIKRRFHSVAYYGREDCNHIWRYRKDSWEDECVPAICIVCGAFGCLCDYADLNNYSNKEFEKIKKIFFDEGVRYDANVNGKWVNPYIEKENKI